MANPAPARHALYSCGHVLMVKPNRFRFNDQTSATNAFQNIPGFGTKQRVAEKAEQQHQALRDLLMRNGVHITLCEAAENTPDAPFCNNWFSTHPAMPGLRDAHGMMEEDVPHTVVLYPLMAENRRIERRADLVEFFRRMYPRIINMSHHEERGMYLESTGSLCMHDAARTVYAALSPRTHRDLAAGWADKMGYRLVAFQATDAQGNPYYHTNVMMYIGHNVASVCMESINSMEERRTVQTSLEESGVAILEITRKQVSDFCGNALSLTNNLGERLLVMSTRAWENYTPRQQETLERYCRVLHTDLSVFEQVGGGSARCLIGELF